MVEYGVYHADFTPWNMLVEGAIVCVRLGICLSYLPC